MVNEDHASIWHGYGGIRPQLFCGHALDLLRLRDVIGHVTVELVMGGFL